MRFKYDSYSKLYPREEIQAPEQIETAVEGFTPTKDAISDSSLIAPTPAAAPQPLSEPIAQQITPQIVPQPEPVSVADVTPEPITDN